MNIRAIFVLLSLGPVAMPALASTVFTDETFNLSNYTATTVAAMGVTVNNTQVVGEGTPGNALETAIAFPAESGTAIAGSYLINNLFVYNPATQGAVVSLSASVNKMIDLQGSGLGSLSVTFLIEQDGSFYAYGLPLPTETGTWLSANASNLVASDFDLITNLAEFTENAADHPSFSSGGPLMFGFRSGFTDGGGGALTANTYIADLSYNINAVPLPSTLGLMLSSLCGFGVLAWRTKSRRLFPS